MYEYVSGRLNEEKISFIFIIHEMPMTTDYFIAELENLDTKISKLQKARDILLKEYSKQVKKEWKKLMFKLKGGKRIPTLTDDNCKKDWSILDNK